MYDWGMMAIGRIEPRIKPPRRQAQRPKPKEQSPKSKAQNDDDVREALTSTLFTSLHLKSSQSSRSAVLVRARGRSSSMSHDEYFWPNYMCCLDGSPAHVEGCDGSACQKIYADRIAGCMIYDGRRPRSEHTSKSRIFTRRFVDEEVERPTSREVFHLTHPRINKDNIWFLTRHRPTKSPKDVGFFGIRIGMETRSSQNGGFIFVTFTVKHIRRERIPITVSSILTTRGRIDGVSYEPCTWMELLSHNLSHYMRKFVNAHWGSVDRLLHDVPDGLMYRKVLRKMQRLSLSDAGSIPVPDPVPDRSDGECVSSMDLDLDVTRGDGTQGRALTTGGKRGKTQTRHGAPRLGNSTDSKISKRKGSTLRDGNIKALWSKAQST